MAFENENVTPKTNEKVVRIKVDPEPATKPRRGQGNYEGSSSEGSYASPGGTDD